MHQRRKIWRSVCPDWPCFHFVGDLERRSETLCLKWAEADGPLVREPDRKSFGCQLIERALPGQLRGEARLLFHASGLVCEVNIPLSAMQER